MELQFPGSVPEIPVSDIAAAVAYYQHNLGFTLDWSDEDLGSFPAAAACLSANETGSRCGAVGRSGLAASGSVLRSPSFLLDHPLLRTSRRVETLVRVAGRGYLEQA